MSRSSVFEFIRWLANPALLPKSFLDWEFLRRAAGPGRQRGAIMTNSFRREAVRCKSEARRFAGKAEEPFLLRLSEAFNELAYLERARTWSPSPSNQLVSKPSTKAASPSNHPVPVRTSTPENA